jgi:hypothetical protein
MASLSRCRLAGRRSQETRSQKLFSCSWLLLRAMAHQTLWFNCIASWDHVEDQARPMRQILTPPGGRTRATLIRAHLRVRSSVAVLEERRLHLLSTRMDRWSSFGSTSCITLTSSFPFCTNWWSTVTAWWTGSRWETSGRFLGPGPGNSDPKLWKREGRDSNPRGSFTPPTRLAGGCFRPLSHLPGGS